MFTESTTEPRPARLGRRLLGSSLARALATPHGVDRYVELVKPTFSLRDVRAEVVSVQRRTPTSATVTLRPNDNWRGFRAGQHVLLSTEIGGVRRTRPYSPANSEHDGGLVELTVHARPGGAVSPHLRTRLLAGDVVGLSQAQGDFALPRRRPRELLLISGGSGITPLMAMLRTLCDEGHDGPIAFLHYARAERHIAYAEALARLAARHPNVRLLRSLTRVGGLGGGELDGHFSADHVELAGIDPEEAEAFVCGPAALVDAVHGQWARTGLEQRLHVERFAPPPLAPLPADADAASGALRFARSGVEAANRGGTLLDQAEAAGLRPQSGCRMGICHTCSCRKLAGAVRDVRSGEISTAPDEQIQICVSVPLGDVTLDI
ncbi:ferredoxin reductase [Conexibacter sp. JD483]|uniref:ferredoxin reductase n=1 Tax=unclassified Conexibacter TaxID=2627773 RepID=UPI0027205FF3|nr:MULTISPECIES: ferredoxin reductase [unclassified Conexibacter]MDO8185241.1 ferredoxin reductase [Conexibacter sp. CPCC 205706]MDO8198287.1 ferredoxin reductase [Conexibacter sp. CPCC 205762]MDR9367751.1 ferredoxin reductase [Conexibacter sp. JD483]